MTAAGEMVEVKPADLKKSDYVATARCPAWGGTGIRTKKVRTGRETVFVEMDNTWLEFCGLWIADGSYGG